MPEYETIRKGVYLRVDGELQQVPAGHKFHDDNEDFNPGLYRKLEVATPPAAEVDEELEALKVEYKEVLGKAPHGRAGKEKLREEIAAAKAEEAGEPESEEE